MLAAKALRVRWRRGVGSRGSRQAREQDLKRGRETHGTGGEMREKDWLPREAQHGKRERATGQERRCVRMALRRSEQVFPSTRVVSDPAWSCPPFTCSSRVQGVLVAQPLVGQLRQSIVLCLRDEREEGRRFASGSPDIEQRAEMGTARGFAYPQCLDFCERARSWTLWFSTPRSSKRRQRSARPPARRQRRDRASRSSLTRVREMPRRDRKQCSQNTVGHTAMYLAMAWAVSRWAARFPHTYSTTLSTSCSRAERGGPWPCPVWRGCGSPDTARVCARGPGAPLRLFFVTAARSVQYTGLLIRCVCYTRRGSRRVACDD